MTEINDPEALNNAIAATPGMLIYFFDDRCMPCVSLRPKVEKLMHERFEKMKLAWINSREFPELPAAWGVFASPTLLLFFDGKETKRFSKYISLPELEQAIERYYRMLFG
jgi:thioredoxin-like negative regulator of GroEL